MTAAHFSPQERARRSARMRALRADPPFEAKRRANWRPFTGKAGSKKQRAAAAAHSQFMKARMADAEFHAKWRGRHAAGNARKRKFGVRMPARILQWRMTKKRQGFPQEWIDRETRKRLGQKPQRGGKKPIFGVALPRPVQRHRALLKSVGLAPEIIHAETEFHLVKLGLMKRTTPQTQERTT
jgi:hypothetical protein